MSDNSFKEIRKQLRTIVKEQLPDVLTKESMDHIYRQLSTEIEFKLTQIHSDVQKALKAMQDRQSSIQDMVLRDMVANQKFHPASNSSTVKEEAGTPSE